MENQGRINRNMPFQRWECLNFKHVTENNQDDTGYLGNDQPFYAATVHRKQQYHETVIFLRTKIMVNQAGDFTDEVRIIEMSSSQ